MFFNDEKGKHKLKLSRPALVVVDLQNYFCNKASPAYLHGVEKIFSVVENLMVNFLQKNKPVVATLHVGASERMKSWWGNEISQYWAKFCLKPDPTHVVYKSTYDAFYQTDLQKILTEQNVDQLIITGVMTHLCVETTARTAFVRDFEVVVVENGTWDKSDWYHFASLKSLAHGFAVVCKAEEILCELES
ncbi:MAG: isochorismatase family protein [Pseudothermotoga sp.]